MGDQALVPEANVERTVTTWSVELMRERLAALCDCLIILAAALIAWRSVWFGHTAPVRLRLTTVAVIRPGERLNLSLPWDAAERHVVIALQTHCATCDASAPFLREVCAAARGNRGTALWILGREPVPAIRTWLRIHGITASEVLDGGDAPNLGITSSPTILVVRGDGVVTDVAVGQLTRADQAQLLGRIVGTPGLSPIDRARRPTLLRSYQQVADALSDAHTILLDVREREAYGALHHPRSLNIPLDELVARSAELAQVTRVLVDCSRVSEADCLAGAALSRAARVPGVGFAVY